MIIRTHGFIYFVSSGKKCPFRWLIKFGMASVFRLFGIQTYGQWDKITVESDILFLGDIFKKMQRELIEEKQLQLDNKWINPLENVYVK